MSLIFVIERQPIGMLLIAAYDLPIVSFSLRRLYQSFRTRLGLLTFALEAVGSILRKIDSMPLKTAGYK